MTVWPGDKGNSPVDCVPSSDLELSGGAVVNGAQIDIEGVDGGFKDDFSGTVLNSRYASSNAIVENGVLKFTDDSSNLTYVNNVNFDTTPITGSVSKCMKGAIYELKFKVLSKLSTSTSYMYFSLDTLTPVRFNRTSGIRLVWKSISEFVIYGYENSGSVILSTGDINVGDTVIFRLHEISRLDSDSFSNRCKLLYKINDNDWIDTDYTVIGSGHVGFGFYAANNGVNDIEFQEFNIFGYTEKSIATVPKSDPFKPLLPANLANLGEIIPTLLGEKKPNTAVYLEGQIYNDDLLFQLQQINPDAVKDDAWASLDGKIGEWTRLAELENGVPFLPPAMLKGLDGEFRPQIVFETDGVNQPQSFAGFSMVWGSDVIAPDAPTIISIAQDGAGAVVLKIVDIFPADAMAAELEVNINNTGYKRVDITNNLTSTEPYMKFIGLTSNVQKAGQVNANFHTISGLQLGDTVKFKARYIDAMGNASAFIESEPITITEAQFEPIFLEGIEEFWEDDDDWQEDWE